MKRPTQLAIVIIVLALVLVPLGILATMNVIAFYAAEDSKEIKTEEGGKVIRKGTPNDPVILKIELEDHWGSETVGYSGAKMIHFENIVFHGETGQLKKIVIPVEKVKLFLASEGGENPILSITAYHSHTYPSIHDDPIQFWVGVSATISVSKKSQHDYWKDFLVSNVVKGVVFKEGGRWVFKEHDSPLSSPIENPEMIEKIKKTYNLEYRE